VHFYFAFDNNISSEVSTNDLLFEFLEKLIDEEHKMNLFNMIKEVSFTLIENKFIAIYLLVTFEKFYTNSELIKNKEVAEFLETIASKIHFLSNEAQLYLALVLQIICYVGTNTKDGFNELEENLKYNNLL
jgi:arginyl-tRNA synthetase